MRNFKTLLLVSSLYLLTTSFIGGIDDKSKTGWYFLAEKSTDGILVRDPDSEDVFAIEKNPVLSIADISRLKLKKIATKPHQIKVIQISLNKSGKKKWSNAKQRILKSGESIVFVCNDTVYTQMFIYGNQHLTDSKIDLPIDPKDLTHVFKYLKAECHDCK